MRNNAYMRQDWEIQRMSLVFYMIWGRQPTDFKTIFWGDPIPNEEMSSTRFKDVN